MNQPEFRIVGATDVGQKRSTNEDCLVIDDRWKIVAIADGMGGHNAGEVASQMVSASVTGQLSLWLQKSKPESVKKNLKKAISRFIDVANQQVFQSACLDVTKRGMGTTLVLAVYHDNKLTIAHVGDSRVYLFRNGSLTQLTKDHSKVQELVDTGLILKEDAHKSPLNNILTRAVGVGSEVTASFGEIELKKCDKVLLCSDGLTNMVPDYSIEEIFADRQSQAFTLERLIELANVRGGSDNITVALGAYDY
jgi:serine/threonine protein phosphatase PrpC